jgi:hypothetical protein
VTSFHSIQLAKDKLSAILQITENNQTLAVRMDLTDLDLFADALCEVRDQVAVHTAKEVGKQ